MNPIDLTAKVPIFGSDSIDYGKEFFPLFLRSTNQKERAKRQLARLLPPVPASPGARLGRAVDVGAGDGVMMPDLTARYMKVAAIEPNAVLADKLAASHPGVELRRTNILDTEFKEGFDLVFVSHVWYYVPKKDWRANMTRCASWVRPGGTMISVLQNTHSAYQRLIRELLDPGFAYDSQPFFWKIAEARPELEVTITCDDAYVATPDLLDLTRIAVFMLNLVPAALLAQVRLPTWGQLRDWCAANYPADERGVHRMSCRQDFAVLHFPAAA